MDKLSSLEKDQHFMRLCLDLASRAEGQTAPNPLVGAIVLNKDGNVIGQGYHARAGERHAEVLALEGLGPSAQGGTLYCSLEPCCHHGRTPPCSEAVIKSGVTRVVVGAVDNNPKVMGGGIKALREAGIEVVSGVLEEECRYQNRGFFKVMAEGLPWLSLKMAVTLDGRIADREGVSRWITGAEARQHVMILRSESDAILVGAATARLDDPGLTVRLERRPYTTSSPLPLDEQTGNNNYYELAARPLRVVIDPNLSLTAGAALFAGEAEAVNTVVFCSHDAFNRQQSGAALPLHVEVIAVGPVPFEEGSEQVNSSLDLKACLSILKDKGVNKILCEGGGRLAGYLLDANLVDELHWFVAPKILGDDLALSAVRSAHTRLLGQVLDWKVKEHKVFGQDVLIHCLLRPCSGSP